jgi:hypothetical protein
MTTSISNFISNFKQNVFGKTKCEVCPKGDIGPIGPKGDRGDIGPIGLKGDIGPIGPKGDRGDIGPIGPKGDRGDIGPIGLKGDIGPMGPMGPIGPSGRDGKDANDISKLMWCEGDYCLLPNNKKGVLLASNAHGQDKLIIQSSLDTTPFNRLITFKNAEGKDRFSLETGENGNTFRVATFNNDGGFIRDGLRIDRTSGLATFNDINAKQLNATNLNTQYGGMGPYKVNFYRKEGGAKCLDISNKSHGGFGHANCTPNNPNQEFTYNPASGYLKHAHSNNCLDTFDGKWNFGTCNPHQNLRFQFTNDSLLKSRTNNDCLDIGGNTGFWKCDGNNTNQILKLDPIN